MSRTEKKKLQEQQSLLASILNSTQDSILSKNLDETITSWNPGSEKLFGYTEKEIVGKNISILIPPFLENEEKEMIKRIKNGEFVDQYETKRLKKDGNLLDVSINISQIHDSFGNITGTAIITRKSSGHLKTGEFVLDASTQKVIPIKSDGITDEVIMNTNITGRKKTEKEVRQISRLNAFISAINQTLAHSKNATDIFKRVCSIAIELGDFKAAWIGMIDATEKKINLVEGLGILPEYLARFTNVKYDNSGPQHYVLKNNASYICNNINDVLELESWKHFANATGVNSLVVLPIRKSGNIIYTFNLYASETNFFNAVEVTLLEEVAGDISFALEVLEKETQKVTAETNLQSIFDNTSEGFILTDTNGIVKAYNKKANDIVLNNVETQISIGSSIFDYIHEDRRENYKIVISKVLTGETINYDHSYEKKDGKKTWINFSIDPVFNSGKIEGICVRGSDITERKTAETQQALFVSIVKSTNDAIITKNSEEIITSWNPGAEKIYGYSAKEVLGKHISILFPPNLKDKEKIILQEIRKGKSIEHYETERLRKDGKIIYVSLTISPIKDSLGNIVGASKISRDITEQKASEEKLRVNEQHLSEAQTIAKVGSWETDLQTFNVNWSEETHHIFETDPKKFRPTHASFLDFVHPEELNSVNATFENSINSQTVNSIEHRIITTTGTLKYVIEKWKIFHNHAGHPVRAVGTCQDITEQKKSEEKLHATSIKLERAVNDLNNIFDSSLDIICTVNANGEFEKVSAASQHVWGYSPEELIGKKFVELVYVEDIDITVKEAEKIVTGIPVIDFENRYVHKYGKVVSMLWSANWDEKLQLVFCIAKDVSEKKRLVKDIETERDQFFDIFLNAPSSIAIVKGPDHVFEMANPPYLQLTGKKDVIGKTVKELFPEVIEQGFINLLDHVYTTGESYIGKEVLLKLNKGESEELVDCYLNFIYRPYRNVEGIIEGVFYFGNDITEQVLSRKEIEKSEKFFKGVIENSVDMITMMDLSGKTIYASPAVSKKFGYTNEECLSLNVADIVHPDDALIMQEFVCKIMLHPGIPLECPLIRDRKKDGTYIWVEGTLTNFLDTEGINAIVANFRDVTERITAENILKANEAFNRTILESSPDCMKVIDNEGRLQFMNINGCKLMEVDDFNTLKNKYWWDLWGDENTEMVKSSVKKSLEGKSARFEAFSPTLKGNGKWWDVMLSPATKTADGLQQIISVSRDITEKKKVEEENRFKANLLNTIGQAVIATDLDGIVNYWNNAAEKMYGWTIDDAIGKNIVNLTPSFATKEQVLEIMEDLKMGSTWSGEIIVRRKDGTNFPALVTDSPIYDDKNKLNGIISISSDITEKKKLEELFNKASSLAVIGSYEVDLVANTIYWSSITKQIHEVEDNFIPELSTAINFYKEGFSRKHITESLQKTIEEGVSFDVELQIITAKGNE